MVKISDLPEGVSYGSCWNHLVYISQDLVTDGSSVFLSVMRCTVVFAHYLGPLIGSLLFKYPGAPDSVVSFTNNAESRG